MFGLVMVLLIFLSAFVVCCALASLPWVVALRARRIALARWEYAAPLLGVAIFALAIVFFPNVGGREAFGLLEGVILVPLAGSSYFVVRNIAGRRLKPARAQQLGLGIMCILVVAACIYLAGKYPLNTETGAWLRQDDGTDVSLPLKTAKGPYDNLPARVEWDVRELKNPHPAMRAAAAQGLGKIGDRAAVPFLLDALKDEHWLVRRDVATALGRIGDPRAVPALEDALGDEEALVRSAAAEALHIISSGAELKK